MNATSHHSRQQTETNKPVMTLTAGESTPITSLHFPQEVISAKNAEGRYLGDLAKRPKVRAPSQQGFAPSRAQETSVEDSFLAE